MKKIIIELYIIGLSTIILPFIIIIILLKKILLIRFGLVFSEKIGHFALDTELFLLKKKENNKKFIIDIIGKEKITSNNYLLKKWKEKFLILNLRYLIISALKLTKYITRSNEHDSNLFDNSDHRYLLNKYDSSINFNKHENNYGIKILLKFGLKLDDKYICIHNRDSFYNKKYLSVKNWEYHKHRNFSIESFNKVINYFSSNNNFIFRVGKEVEEKIKLSDKKIIDYPFNDLKSDFMDLFLIKNCRYYVGCDSGLSCVAYLFRKPMVLTNFTGFNQIIKNAYKKEIIIFKHFYSLDLNRKLSLKEIFEMKINDIDSYHDFKKMKIELLENSQEEIFNACLELENILDGKIEYSLEEKALQDKFWKIIDTNLKTKTNYRTRICSAFLKNNEYFLN